MKLLYIVPKINNEGGVARVLSTKANYFVEKLGYEVHILTQNDGNFPLFYMFIDAINLLDISLKGKKSSFFFQYKKAIQNAVDTLNPDLIIVCDNGLKAFTIPFILKTKIPIIFECHGSKFVEENFKKGTLLSEKFAKIKSTYKNFGATKFNKFVALSSESLKEWGIDNAVVIPNPLWIESPLSAELHAKKVIAVARHSFEKGLDRLLLIWQKIIENHPDWILEIYGKSNGNDSLQLLANSLNLTKNIVFCEPVKNIEDKYLEASIYLMTSRSEGFPMVLMEAMAMGLPCVAYDCPVGPRAIIINNENGFLVEDGNIQSFVQKIELLIENEELRIQMGQNAKKSVAKYDLETIMQLWKSLFESLVK